MIVHFLGVSNRSFHKYGPIHETFWIFASFAEDDLKPLFSQKRAALAHSRCDTRV